jgi:predicted dehydrogenase
MNPNESSRRLFLKKALALSAVAVVPTILTNKVSGRARSASKPAGAGERVNLACCGIGNRGGEDVMSFYSTGLANIVALCDVDMGAPHTLKVLEKFLGVPRFQDFRKMFDKMGNQIEAVSVGVPDHSHFPICMMAMAMGKHVYSEKPLARTFHEIELLMKAAKKYNVVTQMGNQGHSEGNYFQFKAWVEAGIIKDVTAITAHMNSSRRWHGWDASITKYPAGQPVPETLDWDTWLSAARFHDYNKDYVNGQWRCWYDFGLGALGDWGAHIIDTAHEFLNLGLPYEINPLMLAGHNAFFFPQASTISFKFPKRK